MKQIACPVCGEVALALRRGPGRTMRFRLMEVEVPADIELPQCANCKTMPINYQTAQRLDPILQVEYEKQLSKLISVDLDRLADVKPLYEWERQLGLSAGYLSKVRTKPPSPQLVALVRLLANEPLRYEELAHLWSGTNGIMLTETIVLPPPPKPLSPTKVKLQLVEQGDWSIPSRAA